MKKTKERRPLNARAVKSEENFAWAPARIREWLTAGYSREEIEAALRRAVPEIVEEYRRRGQCDGAAHGARRARPEAEPA